MRGLTCRKSRRWFPTSNPTLLCCLLFQTTAMPSNSEASSSSADRKSIPVALRVSNWYSHCRYHIGVGYRILQTKDKTAATFHRSSDLPSYQYDPHLSEDYHVAPLTTLIISYRDDCDGDSSYRQWSAYGGSKHNVISTHGCSVSYASGSLSITSPQFILHTAPRGVADEMIELSLSIPTDDLTGLWSASTSTSSHPEVPS